MKYRVMKNGDLSEPYKGIGLEDEIICSEDGYIYHQDCSTDPIDEGRYEDWGDSEERVW